METFRWMELSSRQFKRYILSGGDLAALPVGSMEAMGPHLPFGVKYFIAKAVAEGLCEAHGGLCLPAVPLSPVYGGSKRGGVSLDFQTALDYIEDAVCEAHENGIRRMLLVGAFEELYYTAAEIFQAYDIPLIHVNPLDLPVSTGKDSHQRFNDLTAGCLKLLGEDALLAKLTADNAACFNKGGFTAPDDGEIKRLLYVEGSSYPSGIFPHFYKKDEYKILPVERIDADGAAAAVSAWIGAQAEPLKAFSTYSQVFPRTRYDRGLRTGGAGYEH